MTQQHAVASAQKGNPAVLHISVQLTKTKQQISNLQNQIQAQQAMYVKHMPQQAPNQDYFKPNMHDPMIPNFGDLSISKEPQVHILILKVWFRFVIYFELSTNSSVPSHR